MVLAHSLACSLTHSLTLGRWLKVSTVKPILSVFLCALFPSVLVFFTPPVTMCHHLPSQRHSHCYLQTLPKNIQKQKKSLAQKNNNNKFCPSSSDFAAKVCCAYGACDVFVFRSWLLLPNFLFKLLSRAAVRSTI